MARMRQSAVLLGSIVCGALASLILFTGYPIELDLLGALRSNLDATSSTSSEEIPADRSTEECIEQAQDDLGLEFLPLEEEYITDGLDRCEGILCHKVVQYIRLPKPPGEMSNGEWLQLGREIDRVLRDRQAGCDKYTSSPCPSGCTKEVYPMYPLISISQDRLKVGVQCPGWNFSFTEKLSTDCVFCCELELAKRVKQLILDLLAAGNDCGENCNQIITLLEVPGLSKESCGFPGKCRASVQVAINQSCQGNSGLDPDGWYIRIETTCCFACRSSGSVNEQ